MCPREGLGHCRSRLGLGKGEMGRIWRLGCQKYYEMCIRGGSGGAYSRFGGDPMDLEVPKDSSYTMLRAIQGTDTRS